MTVSLKQALADNLIHVPNTLVILLTDMYRSGKFFLDAFLFDINPRHILYRSNYSAIFPNNSKISVRTLGDMDETTTHEVVTHLVIDQNIPQNAMIPFITKHVDTRGAKLLHFNDRELIDPESYDIGWRDNPL